MKKNDSMALQGIAVLMMLMHHFFLDISNYPESFFLFPEFFQHFTWTGRMCVAIFSFVSGYGMYQVLKRKSSFSSMIKDCSKRIFQLYARLFLVIIICVYVPKLILGEPIFISLLPGNVIGYNAVYNGAWWFVLEYLWFMILALLLALIVNSDMKKWIRISLIILLLMLGALGKGIIFTNPGVVNFFEVRMQPTFLFIFTEGFIAGKMQDFVPGIKAFDKIQKLVSRMRCPIVGAIFCFTALILRYLYSTEPYRVNADILLVPMLCCGVSLCSGKTTNIKKLFLFMGNNSLYLWLIHNLVYDRMVSFLFKWSGYWFVFFIVLFAVSLGMAILLEKIEKIFKMWILPSGT